MAAPCFCPELPELGPSSPVPTGAIACVCCGAPLELTCTGACGGGHVRASIEAAAPLHSSIQHPASSKRAYTKPTTPRSYKPKVCACSATFQPTGPRDTRCQECKAEAVRDG